MSAFYDELQKGVDTVIESSRSSRRDTGHSLSAQALKERIEGDSATDEEKVEHKKSSLERDRSIDLVRGVLDVLGREVVVGPLLDGQLVDPVGIDDPELRKAFQDELQDRLDIALTLFEVAFDTYPDVAALEPGAVFIPILEELVELVSVESWRDLWTYVETRSKRLTKNMPASRGKALPLLRTINAFLRFLPRTPADLVFRGRVHQFASSVIGIADKSAINMRGDYADIKTTWDMEPVVEVKEEEEKIEVDGEEPAKDEATPADGDVDMEAENGAKATEDSRSTEKASAEKKEEAAQESPSGPDFYSTLWSLQQYFASPPLLAGPAQPSTSSADKPLPPFDDFKQKTDFVLPKLFEQTQKEKAMMGKEDAIPRKRKREAADFFHPRYLTPRRLLDHEYFILFQFLLNLTPASASKQAFTGGMPKDFVLDAENESWIKAKIGSIRDELRQMPGDGTRFEETVLAIIARERHYAQWKNDACPEGIFEVPPLGTSTAKAAAQAWQTKVGPPPRWPFPLGTRSLSKVWSNGFRSLDQLKGWKRETTIEGLQKEIETIEADEEDDKAMGIETDPEKLAANTERKINLNWRAIRLASRDDLRLFGAFANERQVVKLGEAKEAEIKKLEAARLAAEERAKAGDKVAGEAEADGEKSEDEDVLGLKKAKEDVGESAEDKEPGEDEANGEEQAEGKGEGEGAEPAAETEAPAEDEKENEEAGGENSSDMTPEADGGMEVDAEPTESTDQPEAVEEAEEAVQEVEQTSNVDVEAASEPEIRQDSGAETPVESTVVPAETGVESSVEDSEPVVEPAVEVVETVQVTRPSRPQYDRPPPRIEDDSELLDAE